MLAARRATTPCVGRDLGAVCEAAQLDRLVDTSTKVCGLAFDLSQKLIAAILIYVADEIDLGLGLRFDSDLESSDF